MHRAKPKLRELHRCDPLFEWVSNAKRLDQVVPVHDKVDERVNEGAKARSAIRVADLRRGRQSCDV